MPPAPLTPAAQAHVDQARANFALYQKLRADGECTWALTLLFYSALHLVDAWFVQNRYGRPRDHMERGDWIRTHLASIGRRPNTHYPDLLSASMDGRYRLRVFTHAEVGAYEHGEFGHIKAQMAKRGIAW
jgi:hypothetical protein